MGLVKLSRNGFSVQVQPKPLVIEIRRGRRLLLKRTSGEGDYQKEEGWLCFDDVETASTGRDKVPLRCKGREVEVLLKLRLYERLLKVTWETTSGAVQSTSDSWTSPKGNHWYGQAMVPAQSRYHAFPLDGHASEVNPFFANDIQAPWKPEPTVQRYQAQEWAEAP